MEPPDEATILIEYLHNMGSKIDIEKTDAEIKLEE